MSSVPAQERLRLRYSALGDLVDEHGEIIEPSTLTLDQLAEIDLTLRQEQQRQRATRHLIDYEIIHRIDVAIDDGSAPEQYTVQTDRYKLAVTSRRSAFRTDETALRNTLLKHAEQLGVPAGRIERLFRPAGYKRFTRYWDQFVAEVPAAAELLNAHTGPTTRYVTTVEPLPTAQGRTTLELT